MMSIVRCVLMLTEKLNVESSDEEGMSLSVF